VASEAKLSGGKRKISPDQRSFLLEKKYENTIKRKILYSQHSTMQKIKSDLAHFYTENAKKYYQTRQKHWTDGQYFLDYIKSLNLEKPRILELGCGGGRFLSYLKEHWS
jgi:hypothetical protein